MKKLNIAELLKHCPTGMELDSTIVDELYFDEITENNMIKCYTKQRNEFTSICNFIYFYSDGSYLDNIKAKCVIFPKGKTTWKGFQRPFKDGDIIYVCDEYSDGTFTYVAIFKQIEKGEKILSHCFYNLENDYFSTHDFMYDGYNTRFATEEEKEKLFKAIKDNGYEWDPKAKALNKLPKFKVGDKIKLKGGDQFGIITQVADCFYTINCKNHTHYWSIAKQDDWELVQNKFDISTLVPFESKVLVRTNNRKWVAAFYSHYDKDSLLHYCVVGGLWYEQCIPYKNNEYLLDTTNDCDEYYKTWE